MLKIKLTTELSTLEIKMQTTRSFNIPTSKIFDLISVKTSVFTFCWISDSGGWVTVRKSKKLSRIDPLEKFTVRKKLPPLRCRVLSNDLVLVFFFQSHQCFDLRTD